MTVKGTSINRGALVLFPMMTNFSGVFSVDSIDRRFRSFQL